jgi:hypothetical protein
MREQALRWWGIIDQKREISMSKGKAKKSRKGKQQGSSDKINDLSKVTEDGAGEFLTTNQDGGSTTIRTRSKLASAARP